MAVNHTTTIISLISLLAVLLPQDITGQATSTVPSPSIPPSDLPTLGPSGNANGGLAYVHNMTDADWDQLKQLVGEIINTGHGPVVVRNSFHDAGTFNKDNPSVGGPHASMRFVRVANFLENRGLQLAHSLLEPIKQRFGDKISYADLWHFAAAVVVSNSGGPIIPFRPGRADATQAMIPVEGLLPDGQVEDTSPLRTIFGRMGFPPEAVVTLSGAHVLGACHIQNSGFAGQWTRDNTRFSNQYFKNLKNLNFGARPVRMPTFQGLRRSQWNATGNPLTNPELAPGDIMILNTDFAINFLDPQFSDLITIYSNNQTRFYDDFTRFFTQMQELGMEGLLTNQVIDVRIPGFVQH